MIKSIINQFKYFIIPSLLLVLLGAIGLLFIETGDLVLYFNTNRSEIGKNIFAIITQLGEEPIYILLLLTSLFVAFRFAIMIPIIAIIATVVSFGLKSLFKHPRPKIFFQELIENGQVQMIEGIHTLGGYTSFPSGHTLSAFCIFGFAAYFCSTQLRFGKTLQILCFFLAALVGFSRIYLFQHFLKDVTLGALLGLILAIGLAAICENFNDGSGNWYERNLRNLKQKPADNIA